MELDMCSVDEALEEKLKQFVKRKQKNTAGLLMKIIPESMKIVLDEEFEDVTIEEIAAELPACQPRYLFYSNVLFHTDKRISYPQILIFISPQGCKPELQMMYTGSIFTLRKASKATKNAEVRSAEELTTEWLNENMPST